MRKDDVERLRTSQALAILNLPEFAEDREKILRKLLNSNGIPANLFSELHTEAGCVTTSEFVYSRGSGFMGVDLIEVKANYFRRKCETHQVESAEFAEIGIAPGDWDGISTSRRIE